MESTNTIRMHLLTWRTGKPHMYKSIGFWWVYSNRETPTKLRRLAKLRAIELTENETRDRLQGLIKT